MLESDEAFYMSQECVVWNDESETAAATVPPSAAAAVSNASARTTDRCHHTNTASLASSNNGNDGHDKHEIESLFSLLGKNGEEKVLPGGRHPEAQQSSLMAAAAPHLLQQQPNDKDGFPTPVHRNRAGAANQQPSTRQNRHSFPPTNDASQHHSTDITSFNTTAIGSAPAGTRKKRPVSLGSAHHHPASRHEKLHKREPSSNHNDSRNTSPVPMSTTGKRRLSAGGVTMKGFDDLLQQVETPSPAGGQQQQQQQQQRPHVVATNPDSISTAKENSQPLVPPASSTAIRMKPKSLGDGEFLKQPPPSGNNSNTDKENNAVAPNANASASHHYHQHNHQKQQNQVTPLSDHPIHSRSTGHHQCTTAQPYKSTSTNTGGTVPRTAVVPSNPSPPNLTDATTTKASTRVDEFGDDDEFGDFDFTDEDFAQVDCLVAATQAQQYSQQQQQDDTIVPPVVVPSLHKSNNALHRAITSGITTAEPPTTHKPRTALLVDGTANRPHGNTLPAQNNIDSNLDRASRSIENPGPQHNQESSKVGTKFETTAEEDDPFDDFPDDIDFDALDQALPGAVITAKPKNAILVHNAPPQNSDALKTDENNTKIKVESNNTVVDDDPFGDFPDDDIDFDQLDAAVAATQQRGAPLKCSQPTPVDDRIVRNQPSDTWQSETSYLSFSRYKIVRYEKDESTFSQRLIVKPWDNSMLDGGDRQALHKPSTLRGKRQAETEDNEQDLGMLILRGSWFYLDAEDGDIVHLCSLTGRFKTDVSALPIILDTDSSLSSVCDDLVLIIHPEQLAIPTTVTDTIDCPRRAVLKSRLGSKMSSSKALLLGTLRHGLFEVALQSKNTSREFIERSIKKIVRSEAQRLVGCRMSSADAERELSKFWPQVEAFEREFIKKAPDQSQRFGSMGDFLTGDNAQKCAITEVKGVEEEVTSPELGLKGNVDMLVEAMTSPTPEFDNWLASGGPNSAKARTLMSVELKTHHNSNPQTKHAAQLTYYTMMLLSRFGHTASANFKKNPKSSDTLAGSILLYINDQSMKAIHIAPTLSEIKSLIEQRNTFCSASARASRPRGVALSYDEEDDESAPKLVVSPATPARLPALENAATCSRCFSARECMVYTASGSSSPDGKNQNEIKKSHADVLDRFTGQLTEEDLAYFRTWDRLIDLEADATNQSIAEAWLETSAKRERSTGKCISALVYQPQPSQVDSLPDEHSVAFIVFERSPHATLRTPLCSLNLQKGCYVTCSTDATSLDAQSFGRVSVLGVRSGREQAPFRHQMKIFRATVDHIGEDKITIRTSEGSVTRLNDLMLRYRQSSMKEIDGTSSGEELEFRLDVDNSFSQMGTLRMNLIDLLTKDKDTDDSKDDPKLRMVWLQKRYSRLRELVIRLRAPVFDKSLEENMFNPSARVRSLPGCDPSDLVEEFTLFMNKNQQSTCSKVVSMRDYALIQGLPGTGKTRSIVFVARMLAAQGKRVLITSYTHSAVDNCMLKLIESGVAAVWADRPTPAVLRIGEKSSVHPGVHSILASNVAAEVESRRSNSGMEPSAESYRTVIGAARIVGISTLKIPKCPLLAAEHFDVVIVDEAGQITQPALIGALSAADAFVLVGDHMQLPPLVASESALEGGFGESMLKRLAEAHPGAVVQLNQQYRMHKEICSLASNAIYNGYLVNGVEVPRLQLQKFPKALSSQEFGNSSRWVQKVVNPFRPVVFVDTDGMGQRDTDILDKQDNIVPLERAASRQAGGNTVNDTEAMLVSRIVEALVSVGLSPTAIGIICPFNAQIRLLEESAVIKQHKTDGLEISTIDKYQGRDKDVIIVSFVRSNNKGKVGRLLEDKRRINVAITRSKHKLILVGSFSTLQQGSATMKGILDEIRQLERVEKLPSDAL